MDREDRQARPDTTGVPPEAQRATPAEKQGAGDQVPQGVSLSPGDIVVPDDAADLDREPHFELEDYPESIDGTARAKLHESQVAPLIAVARGYTTIRPSDAKEFTARVCPVDLDAKTAATRRRQVNTALEVGDAMAMPWYAADDVINARTARAPETIVQIRPAKAIATGTVNNRGQDEAKKYDLLAGSATPVDMHPSQPPEWAADTAVRIVFTEGIIKADSAMTAMLLAHGSTPEDLLVDRPEGETAEDRVRAARIDAHRKLRRLLRDVPTRERTLFLAAVGVGNWRGPSWGSINLKGGRDFRIAFDGDMTRNLDVWKQTDRLWRQVENKGATPSIVDLTMAAADDPTAKKLGLDDYFGIPRLSCWGEILSGRLTVMPPRPDGGGTEGEWRVHPDTGATVQEWIVPNEDGAEPFWMDVLSYGARVKSMTTRTGVSEQDLKNGRLSTHTNASSEDRLVELEFTWNEGSDEECGIVTGNFELLQQTPANWTRYANAVIPDGIGLRHDWPPRNKAGEKFTQAIKMHRSDEVMRQRVWDSMGWVPGVGDEEPAFVIGNQMFPITPTDEPTIRPGVTSDTLHGAERFGLPDLDVTPDQEGFADYAFEIIRDVADALLGRIDGVPATHQAIQRPEYGAVILMAGLRPLVPVAPRMTVYLAGPPGKGKSYLAGCAMSFFQREPGGFAEGTLPGSAEDSVASTEHALSRAPIWVMDDLAPKQDKRAAQRQADIVDQVIRAVHNGQSRGRMQKGGDGNFQQRQREVPRAMLLVTGEMAPSVSSIRQRSIILNMDGSALGPMQYKSLAPLDEMRDDTNLFAKLSRIGLEAMISVARRTSWRDLLAIVRDVYETTEADISKDGTGSRRAAKVVADLSRSIAVLRAIQEEFFDDHEVYADYVEELCRELMRHAASTVADANRDSALNTPGVRLLDVLIRTLRAGNAHILNPSKPDAPPLVGGNEEALSNQMLGWVGGAPKSHSKPIGHLYGEDHDGEPLVMIDVSSAFAVASQYGSDQIGEGASGASLWASAWDSGVLDPGSRMRARNGKNQFWHYCQVRLPNSSRLSAAPIRLAKLLGREPLVPGQFIEEKEGEIE